MSNKKVRKRLSPSAFEASDTKDLTISRLRAEAGELTRTQSNFVKLSSELSQLERKFKQLNEEKIRNETSFIAKHELNQQTIMELRSELAQIKLQIRDKNAEADMLKSQKEIKHRENMNFQEKMAGLVFQLNEEREQEGALTNDIKRMQFEVSTLASEKTFRKSRKIELRREIDLVNEKNLELESFYNESDYERTRIGKLISQQESENNNISLQIEANDQKLKFVQQKMFDTDEAIQRSKQNLEEKRAYKERLLLDVKMSEKTQKNENLRGDELRAKLTRLEQSYGKKREDIDQIKSKVVEEERKSDSIRSLIEQLTKDREALKKRIENLQASKQKIFSEVQRIDQENEQINYLLTNAVSAIKQNKRTDYLSTGADAVSRILKSNEKFGSLKNSKYYSGD